MLDDTQRLFRDVSALRPEDRAAWLANAGIPEEQREELESLLRYDAGTIDGLTGAIGETAAELLDCIAVEENPRLGAWRVDRLIGRGGMGVVFLAHREDGEVRQSAAIKLVRNASAPEFRDRFIRERQILASLNHPAIARLIDAGRTSAGQPWYAMEYIEGTSIDLFARDLDLRAKIQLILAVMEGIGFAHRNLVIHRDLKPSNILVTAAGQPKLLDFGIARMLDPEATNVTSDRALTLAYASPEQVMGDARGTATDIYSLAAVLYRLVAGEGPHAAMVRIHSNETMERLICFRDSPPARSLNSALPRDLDFILSKGLRKEPEARYSSIELFAADLRAWLESKPIGARSGNLWYVGTKWFRRHWLPASLGAAAVGSLAVGLYVANRERILAQDRFDKLRQLANRLILLDAGADGLSIEMRQSIVTSSTKYLDELSQDAANNSGIALEVARGYLKTAEVQGVPAYPGLGHFADAEKSLKKAAGLTESVPTRKVSRDAILLDAEIDQDLMMVASTLQKQDDTLVYAKLAAARLDSVEQKTATSAELKGMANSYGNIGLGFLNLHRLSDAAVYARKSADLARATGAPPSYLAGALSLLANVQRQAGDLDGALQSVEEARKVAETAEFPSPIVKASILYTILWREGLILGESGGVSLGRYFDAIPPLRAALESVDRLASESPHDATSRDRVATSSRTLGDILVNIDPAESLRVLDHAIARQRELKDNPRARALEGILLARSSYALRKLDRRGEARARIVAATQLLAKANGDAAQQSVALLALADSQSETDAATALASYRQVVQQTLAEKPGPASDLGQATTLSGVYEATERAASRLKQPNDAAQFRSARIELWRNWDRTLPKNAFVSRQLSSALTAH